MITTITLAIIAMLFIWAHYWNETHNAPKQVWLRERLKHMDTITDRKKRLVEYWLIWDEYNDFE